MDAIIKLIKPTGSVTHMAVRTAGVQVNTPLRKRTEARPCDAVSLTVRPGASHLVDTATGRRLG